MQKKLLAVAVSGALGAIAAPAAQAQNATVNVYGALVAEYASIRHGNRGVTATTNPGAALIGDPYRNIDQLQNPGSAIGFRGEEKLGGGMSVWFQCESTMDWRGSVNSATPNQAQGICNRDSAFGVKGGFGNIFMGNWGTPLKRVTNDLTGANDTGVFGVGRILYGNSSTYGTNSPNGAGDGRLGAGVWRRRQTNLVAYDTPNLSGFTGMAAYTTANNSTGATDAQLKSRLWSIGGQYANGPLRVGLAYEKHNDFYGTANALCVAGSGACIGTSESAWALTGSYTFTNNLKLGAQYSRQTATAAATQTDSRIRTWMVGVDWTISGPHGLKAAYARAGDISGGLTAAGVPGIAQGSRPGPAAVAAGGFGETGASHWSVRYVHALSKRTELSLGYARLDNKRNATYEIGGTNTTVFPGSDANAFAFGMTHRF